MGAGSSLTATATGGVGNTETDGGEAYIYFDGAVTMGAGASLTATATGGAAGTGTGGYAGEAYIYFEEAVAMGAGASLTATATGGAVGTGTDGGEAYVYFEGPVTMGNGASLTATATAGAGEEAYMYFEDGVTLGNGATLTASVSGGAGDDSEGYIYFEHNVTLGTGASLNATAEVGAGADTEAYVEFDDGVVTLGSGASLNVTTSGGTSGEFNGGYFYDRINGDGPGTGSLTVTGNALFDDPIGSLVPIESLHVTGTTLFDFAENDGTYSAFTSGPQHYDGGVTIDDNTILATYSTTIEFGTTLEPPGTRPYDGHLLTILYLLPAPPPKAMANVFPPPFIFPPPVGLPQPGQADVQDMAKLGIFLQPALFDGWLFEGRWFYDDTQTGLPPKKL